MVLRLDQVHKLATIGGHGPDVKRKLGLTEQCFETINNVIIEAGSFLYAHKSVLSYGELNSSMQNKMRDKR